MTKNHKNNNENDLISMSLGDHLEELRSRLIMAIGGLAVALVAALVLGRWFLAIVFSPFQSAMLETGIDAKLQAIDPAEPFILYLKASLVLAALMSSPWLFYQIWAFVSAGLYKHERRFVYVAAPASTILFITGVLFFLLGIAPLVFRLFAQFNLGIEHEYRPQISKTFSFVLMLSLVFGVAFQTPIAVVFAERMGLVSVETLCRGRKYVFISTFILAAIATPPDPFSQITLAVSLYILYEGGIAISRFWRKKRTES